MIRRAAQERIEKQLHRFPVVGLVGGRQTGKTTLAKALVAGRGDAAIYLDLELPSDAAKLGEPELFLDHYRDRLVVLDEIQRAPDLFPILRALVDQERRPGRFLVLGSASPDLLGQSSESLAGRIAYEELGPLHLPEVLAGPADGDWKALWLRGGYPLSYLADDEDASFSWREEFVRTHLARDLQTYGLRVSEQPLRRFWLMLAHGHGQLWNANAYSRSLQVSAPTVRSHLDLLCDLYLVRRLPAFHANLKKRLVKAPKVYFRDSGLLHASLGIRGFEKLHGHPVIGRSFEGFAIDAILGQLPSGIEAAFYRTHAGAEIDLVLTRGVNAPMAVEIKYTGAPRLRRGLPQAMEDLGCRKGYIVTAGASAFPLASNIRAIPLPQFLDEVLSAWSG